MEAFAQYLLKSVIWLSLVTVVYFLFLRNERFFVLKRYYLLAGIVISFIFPLFTFHYNVEVPDASVVFEGLAPATVIHAGSVTETGMQNAGHFRIETIFLILYFTGTGFFLLRLFSHLRVLLGNIRKAKIKDHGHARLIRNSELSGSFSFFNYVFINPSVNEPELEIIMKHELVHVNQKHWFDLCLSEILCLFQWINPLAWSYHGLIRQNHEYIADGEALKHISDHAMYKAVLINSLFNSEVVTLSDSFNYSLNKKRFEMMKNIVFSPYRKLKVLIVLPLFAIMFYAFASPEYHYADQPGRTVSAEQKTPGYTNASDLQADNSTKSLLLQDQKREVKGVVVQQDGKPLNGAVIINKGTTEGTISDEKGSFRLGNLTDESELVVTFVGFKTEIIKPVFNSEMAIRMQTDTVKYHELRIINEKDMAADPLIVIDGKITEYDISRIPVNNPDDIISVAVIKPETATARYGAKGQNGVIEISTRLNKEPISSVDPGNEPAGDMKTQTPGEKPFVVVEALPEFSGGEANLDLWLLRNIKYPEGAKLKKPEGKVYVSFSVTSLGKIADVRISKPLNPLLDAEALRVVRAMPDWKPGRQAGRPVDVKMELPVEFRYPN